MCFHSEKNTPPKEFNILMKASGQTDTNLGHNIICKFTIVFKLFYTYWQHLRVLEEGFSYSVAQKIMFFLLLCSLNSCNTTSTVLHIYLLLQETQVAKMKYVTKTFGLCELSTVLHQKSSSPLLEFCVCSYSQTTERKPPESQTFPHMQICFFPKC